MFQRADEDAGVGSVELPDAFPLLVWHCCDVRANAKAKVLPTAVDLRQGGPDDGGSKSISAKEAENV